MTITPSSTTLSWEDKLMLVAAIYAIVSLGAGLLIGRLLK